MMLTNIPGSSLCFKQGWVTYSNESKATELGIHPKLIETHGAVSREVAGAMATQARKQAQATWAIGITGIAGPDSDSPEKPVGLVYISIAGPQSADDLYIRTCHFSGDRHSVRLRSSQMALTLLRLKLLGHDPQSILPP